MKRCPACRRDYHDDSLVYCLEDGTPLVQGAVPGPDEPQTAILHDAAAPAVAAAKAQTRTNEKTEVLTQEQWSRPAFDKGMFLVPAALLVVIISGFLGYRYFASPKQIDSIAVMPFTNESGNPDNEYLSDGVTESLIKSLSNIPNLNVKARSSVFRYKGVSKSLKEIAAELGVQAILNGRVTQRGDDITMSLELIDGIHENVLWTERYTRKQSELAAIQSEIARDVSNNLKAKLSPAEQAKVAKEYTANADAYQLYLRGMYLINKATPESQKGSLEFFDKAIAADPNFALAYTAKADAYALLGTIFSAQMDAHVAIKEARAAADEALRLDPTLSGAYTSRGWIKFRYDWDWRGAEDDLKKGVELDPKNAHAHHWLGEFLGCMGRFDEGISELRTARTLEPFVPIIGWNLGKNLMVAGRNDEALTEFQNTLELDANFSRVFRDRSEIYEQKGMMNEAFADFLKVPENLRLEPAKIAELKHVFETSGLTAARRRSAEWYLPTAPTASNRAIAYLTIGEKQKAIDELEHAYSDRNGTLVGLATDLWWGQLRDEPRFREIVKKMNFPNALR